MVDAGLNEVVTVKVVAGGVEGDVVLRLEPGMHSDAHQRALDSVLAGPLTDAAASIDLVLAARPSAFALEQPGRDEVGRTRYVVRGRREGDRLVPALRAPKPPDRRKGRPR